MKTILQKITSFNGYVTMYILLSLITFNSNAQTKGVWGSLDSVKYQKAGQTYAGAKGGFGGAPTGISLFTYLSKNTGVELTIGYNKNNPITQGSVNTFIGVSFQPRLNFRTKNITGAYYLNLGGRARMQKLGDQDQGLSPRQSNIVTPGFVFGLGASLEIYKNFQLFAEMNQAYHADPYATGDKNSYVFSDMETSVGVRCFIF